MPICRAPIERLGALVALGLLLLGLLGAAGAAAPADRTPRALNDQGLRLSDQAEFAAAEALLAEAAATAPADHRGLYQANQALNLRRQFRDVEAETLLRQALWEIDRYRGPTNGWRPCNLLRSRAVALIQLSRIEERRGQLAAALTHALAAQQAAASALQQVPAQATVAERHVVASDLANAHRREVMVHIQGQQSSRAEEALARWQATAERHSLGPVVQAQIRAATAQFALSRQRFDEAADAAEQADAGYADAGFAAHHLARVALLETRLAALWARERAAEALPLLQALDLSVARDIAQGARPDPLAVQMPLLRGLVFLDAGRHADAAALFGAHAQRVQRIAGAQSLWLAEARGLQGVALWAGDAAARARAGPLLAEAVTALTDPLNASAPDGSGLRALIRRRVVQAYVAHQLDAVATPDMRTAALLDWVSDGPVQRAVTQAAARMSIADPALRELVRQEQNLRRALDAWGRGVAAAGLGSAGDDDGRAAGALAPDVLARLASLRERWSEAAERLRARYPDYAGLVQPAPPTLERVSQALGAGEALLVLAHREQDTLLWLLRHDGHRSSRRVTLPLAQAQALVAALRSTLELPENGRPPAFDRRSAGELHRLLIEPLRDELAGVKHLAVVTSGPLAALPLALLAPDDGRPSRDADWLIRRTAISQTSSLAAWLAARRSTPAARDDRMTLLGWGDPLFGTAGAHTSSPRRDLQLPLHAAASSRAGRGSRTGREAPDPRTAFPSLPDTRDELLAIAHALGADPESSLHLGPRATRESVLEASRSGRLAAARVIAFATHGLKAGEWPGLEQPALVMAIPEQGAVPDATAHMLSLDDTLSLELDADWVVLSACNTTAGDHEAGEALSGLARGMFYAGARSLLATHWAVESRSAALLVSETFRAYAGAERPGKAQALRSAMLALMARPGLAHPFYWAPYGVIGDGAR